MINVRRISIAYILYKRRNKKTRVHVDPFLENRLLAGAFVTHFGKLQNNERKFKNYFRMSIRSFDELLCKIENKLQKRSLRRITIQPIERLAITLRYLATGNTFTDLHYSYMIGIATISEIVRQVCYIIWIELKSECIPQLNGIKWKEIAEGFLTYTNFPNCLGAIDGKHIRVIRPPHSGSLYFNYKKYYSVVLLAMCDADYNFTYINVGTSGSNADSTIFRRSQLYTKLESNTLGIPDPQELPIICPEVAYPSSVRAKLPFVIVGDEAFGLSSHMMRPYARDNLPYKKKIFNYRLSRARRCRIPECDSSSPKFEVPWWPTIHVDNCAKPVLNTTIAQQQGDFCTNNSFTVAVDECRDWIYENNKTVYSTLNLACQPWKVSLIGAIHNIGMALAMLVAGWMADTIGRKPTIVICSVACCIGNFKTLANSYPVYIGLEFLESALSGGVYTAGSVIMIEIGNKKNRMLAGVLFAYAIYMGEAVFAVIAMLVPYWKTLIHIICSPTILFLSYIFLVRESPRWQILTGRAIPAKDTLKLIVKTNKLNTNIDDIDHLDEEKLKVTFNMEGNSTTEGFREVFRCREVLKRFLVATVCRFTVTFIYYGLIINSVWLPGNKYTNFLLAAIMSFPGELISMYLMNKIGRKKPLICGYLLCGISCVACGVVPGSYTWLKICLFLFGKLVTSACYTGIVTYTMELFPTSVRGSLLGLCTLASSVGNMVAPLTPVMATVSPVLAPVCFGCTAVIASCLLILTPETRDLPLMDTIDQVARSVATKANVKPDNRTDEGCTEDRRRGEVF